MSLQRVELFGDQHTHICGGKGEGEASAWGGEAGKASGEWIRGV